MLLWKLCSLRAPSLLRLLTESRLLLGLYKKVLKIQFICFLHSLRTFSVFFHFVIFPLKAVPPAVLTLTRGCRRGWTPSVALCDVTKISDSPHAFSLASQRGGPALFPAPVRTPPVVTECPLHATRCQGMSVKSAALRCPCCPVGRGPGQAAQCECKPCYSHEGTVGLQGGEEDHALGQAQPLGSALNKGRVRLRRLACVPSSWVACSFPAVR